MKPSKAGLQAALRDAVAFIDRLQNGMGDWSVDDVRRLGQLRKLGDSAPAQEWRPATRAAGFAVVREALVLMKDGLTDRAWSLCATKYEAAMKVLRSLQ
jgi:hypothetical protein